MNTLATWDVLHHFKDFYFFMGQITKMMLWVKMNSLNWVILTIQPSYVEANHASVIGWRDVVWTVTV